MCRNVGAGDIIVVLKCNFKTVVCVCRSTKVCRDVVQGDRPIEVNCVGRAAKMFSVCSTGKEEEEGHKREHCSSLVVHRGGVCCFRLTNYVYVTDLSRFDLQVDCWGQWQGAVAVDRGQIILSARALVPIERDVSSDGRDIYLRNRIRPEVEAKKS